jgi:hypothetical protein
MVRLIRVVPIDLRMPFRAPVAEQTLVLFSTFVADTLGGLCTSVASTS